MSREQSLISFCESWSRNPKFCGYATIGFAALKTSSGGPCGGAALPPAEHHVSKEQCILKKTKDMLISAIWCVSRAMFRLRCLEHEVMRMDTNSKVNCFSWRNSCKCIIMTAKASRSETVKNRSPNEFLCSRRRFERNQENREKS